MQHLHKLPTYRHPDSKARAVLSPIYGTDKYSLDVFAYKSRTGRIVCEGYRSACISWLKANGYIDTGYLKADLVYAD